MRGAARLQWRASATEQPDRVDAAEVVHLGSLLLNRQILLFLVFSLFVKGE